MSMRKLERTLAVLALVGGALLSLRLLQSVSGSAHEHRPGHVEEREEPPEPPVVDTGSATRAPVDAGADRVPSRMQVELTGPLAPWATALQRARPTPTLAVEQRGWIEAELAERSIDCPELEVTCATQLCRAEFRMRSLRAARHLARIRRPGLEHILSMPEPHPEGGLRVVAYFSPTGTSMQDLLSQH